MKLGRVVVDAFDPDRSNDVVPSPQDEEGAPRRLVVSGKVEQVGHLDRRIVDEAVFGEDAADERDHAGDVVATRRLGDYRAGTAPNAGITSRANRVSCSSI